ACPGKTVAAACRWNRRESAQIGLRRGGGEFSVIGPPRRRGRRSCPSPYRVQCPPPGPPAMESLRIDFSPSTGTEGEWNVAYARLSDYFRALRIHSRLHRTYLVLETLRRAAVTHAKHPEMTPTAVAIHEARRMQRDWLRGILGDLNVPEGRLDASGRLAFLLC